MSDTSVELFQTQEIMSKRAVNVRLVKLFIVYSITNSIECEEIEPGGMSHPQFEQFMQRDYAIQQYLFYYI